jgi:type I restriction enzyme S subunit
VFQNQCKEYLLYSLQSKYVLRQQKAWFVGNAQPFLDTKAISGFSIAIPPNVGEQCTIAGALGDVDALLAELEKLIAKKRDLKQAAMQELLTGKKRLPGFKGEWAAKTLKQLGDISGAGVDKKIRPNEVAVRLVNYLDVYKRDFIYSRDLYHIVSAPLEQANRCLVKKGDVFFTPSSEVPNDIGVSAVAMEDIPDAVYSYHVVRLRLPEDWDLKYRAYAFKSRQFLDQAERLCEGSGIRYVLTQARFRQLTVLVPPTTQEQAAIGTILFDMDAEIAALEQRREKTYALKQGMMQELLTGQTRLV